MSSNARRTVAFPIRTATSVLVCLWLACGASLALAQTGGLGIYELGNPGTGRANAGMAAYASDASIAYFNPAAMTGLGGHHVLGGLQVTGLDVTFVPGARTTVSGGDGGNAGGLFPGGGLYGVFSVSERVRLGVAFNVPWGAAFRYDEDWVGRYHILTSAIVGVNLNPSVGVKITDWFSAGLGVQVSHFSVKQEVAFNSFSDGSESPDGQLEVSGGGWTAGLLVGTTFKLSPSTVLGATYRSPIPVDIDSDVSFSDFGPGNKQGVAPGSLNLGFTMPMAVDVSLKQDVRPLRLVCLFDAGWTNASVFSQNVIGVGETTRILDRQLRDTFRVAVGFEWSALPQWVLQTGYAYESSTVRDEFRTPDLPIGAVHRVSLGTTVEVSKLVTLGAHYTVGIMGDSPMDVPASYPGSGRVQGTYDNTFLHFGVITLALHWGEDDEPQAKPTSAPTEELPLTVPPA